MKRRIRRSQCGWFAGRSARYAGCRTLPDFSPGQVADTEKLSFYPLVPDVVALLGTILRIAQTSTATGSSTAPKKKAVKHSPNAFQLRFRTASAWSGASR